MDNRLEGLESWEVLQQFLPPGWAEQARATGDLRRNRGVRDAGAVLRVLLMHLGQGCSLAVRRSAAAPFSHRLFWPWNRSHRCDLRVEHRFSGALGGARRTAALAAEVIRPLFQPLKRNQRLPNLLLA